MTHEKQCPDARYGWPKGKTDCLMCNAIRAAVAEATATAQKDREWGAARGAALTEIRKMLGVEWAGQDVVQAVRSVGAKLAEAERERDAARTALAEERWRIEKLIGACANLWYSHMPPMYPSNVADVLREVVAGSSGLHDTEGERKTLWDSTAALRAQEGKA